ncbi:MAG: SIS domain-containing protein [Microcystis sp. Msp_OC_L_20101000_S702]|uniref:D-sedoheptulose 7-phosphate isomerase n=1 Tax=Microcystis sp. Msp_OC_L_20101000_S702 TaxID=2486218 RepID=UPI00118FAD23|nr:D-sedoheptulose 7-phosphate isomerase [Microcystis sp. Msp_OC_L_20101000_S702]TRU14399.1 MAG: SIS domain-containing protein [Microcystis sp. Msp_OC_L_20101000_S702]
MESNLDIQEYPDSFFLLQKQIQQSVEEHTLVINSLANYLAEIQQLATLVVKTLKTGNKILLMGNGGSAADAQHIAAEIVGRFTTERRGLPAIALTTDTSILTSIGNDYGYDNIFSRQVEALANANDLVIGISTSGNSKNVLQALTAAASLGCQTAALLGKGGGEIKNVVNLSLIVPSSNTARIQEAHILIGHILCQVVDSAFTCSIPTIT